jgi:hypothetical protein
MIYDYECPTCGEVKSIVGLVRDHAITHPCGCGAKMVQVISAAMVTPDIAPYRAVAGDRAGEWITSRKDHREFLKRNRFVEVGNEPIKPIRNDFRPKKGEVAKELKTVLQGKR